MEAGRSGSAPLNADFATYQCKQHPLVPGRLRMCLPRHTKGMLTTPQIRDTESSCSLLLFSLPSHKAQQETAWLQKIFHSSKPWCLSWRFLMCPCLIFAMGFVDLSQSCSHCQEVSSYLKPDLKSEFIWPWVRLSHGDNIGGIGDFLYAWILYAWWFLSPMRACTT